MNLGRELRDSLKIFSALQNKEGAFDIWNMYYFWVTGRSPSDTKLWRTCGLL